MPYKARRVRSQRREEERSLSKLQCGNAKINRDGHLENQSECFAPWII